MHLIEYLDNFEKNKATEMVWLRLESLLMMMVAQMIVGEVSTITVHHCSIVGADQSSNTLA